ncbi:MAG: AsmA family protein [Nitrospirota bacterium]
MPINIKRILKITSVILIIFILFFISLAYFGYLDFKKTLITKISAESTLMIGQKVDIGDLSFSPSAGINIYDICIMNPQGFDSGQLLRIKRLYLKMKFSDFFKGRFYFRNITVFSPEFILIKDRNGRLNVSDKLLQLFKRKPTIKYQIDEFDIDSGIFDFNKDKRYGNDNINLHLKNLSSEPGTKTLINGHTSYAGENKIKINGWAYLKDEPKKLNISVSSDDYPFPAFKYLLNKHKINAGIEKANVNIKLPSSGEISVRAEAVLKILKTEKYLLDKPVEINLSINTLMDLNKGIGSLSGDFAFSTGKIQFHGISPASIAGKGKFNGKDFYAEIPQADVFGGIIKLNLDGKTSEGPFPVKISLTAQNIDASHLYVLSSKISEIPYSISGNIKSAAFNGTLNSLNSLDGKALLKAKGISVLEIKSKRNILKNIFLDSEIKFAGDVLELKSDAGAGSISAIISGTVKGFMNKDRSIKLNAKLPEVKATDIRDSFWNIFPDSLLYAGLDGYLSSDFSIDYSNSKLSVNGELRLKNFSLSGENNEYFAGPVNGIIPVAYAESDYKQEIIKIPSFEHSEFDNMTKYYSQKTSDSGFSRITIGSFSYGFELLENIVIWLNQKGRVLNINHFSANIFGGRLNGSGIINISDGLKYRVGILLKGLSLAKLCEGIEPIKGYISGKVDGVANIKGTGVGISKLIGKADFWTYSTKDEKTKISKEFLQKVGGPSLKTYLGDRSFDKGIMSLYLQDGFVIFKELEISNRNLIGIKDLSVKVAPFNNKIAIDHLMWTLTEAAQRAKEKK